MIGPANGSPEKVTPWQKEDGEWITIAGSVSEAGLDQFTLNYGEGEIVVEMDDFDRQMEALHFKPNDQVIVTGKIDHDKGQRRTIEAGSVFVENIQQSFFASAEDEEDQSLARLRQNTAGKKGTLFIGTLSQVMPKQSVVTLNTGYQKFQINTARLLGKKPGKKEEVQLRNGQRVAIFAQPERGAAQNRKLVALALSELD